MRDSSPDIEQRMTRMMAARTPADRLRMACSMFDAGRKLMIAGLLEENGNLTKAQLRARIFIRLYGDLYTPQEIHNIVHTIPDMEFTT
ncbi:MAG: hypothetical protein JW795_00550 [Chitinivibrionales bacterium]|nr:hypothetical protein [Chitinivibrionales bacterium]